jgi:AhpD family alkylhydroperoxidase
MAHIQLQEDLPGIRGLMVFRPETAEPLNQLADLLLRGPNTLSPGEREVIATVVSSRNDCFFCQNVHGAVAAHHLGDNEQLVLDVKQDPEHAAVSDKMKAPARHCRQSAARREGGNQRGHRTLPGARRQRYGNS